jgi:hypothetical protein
MYVISASLLTGRNNHTIQLTTYCCLINHDLRVKSLQPQLLTLMYVMSARFFTRPTPYNSTLTINGCLMEPKYFFTHGDVCLDRKGNKT